MYSMKTPFVLLAATLIIVTSAIDDKDYIDRQTWCPLMTMDGTIGIQKTAWYSERCIYGYFRSRTQPVVKIYNSVNCVRKCGKGKKHPRCCCFHPATILKETLRVPDNCMANWEVESRTGEFFHCYETFVGEEWRHVKCMQTSTMQGYCFITKKPVYNPGYEKLITRWCEYQVCGTYHICAELANKYGGCCCLGDYCNKDFDTCRKTELIPSQSEAAGTFNTSYTGCYTSTPVTTTTTTTTIAPTTFPGYVPTEPKDVNTDSGKTDYDDYGNISDTKNNSSRSKREFGVAGMSYCGLVWLIAGIVLLFYAIVFAVLFRRWRKRHPAESGNEAENDGEEEGREKM